MSIDGNAKYPVKSGGMFVQRNSGYLILKGYE